MSDPEASRAASIPAGPRALAFGLTWTAYATYYLGRKGVGVVKTRVTDELGSSALVGVETALLASYALGQYVSGFVGDRVGARRLVSLGLLASALTCFAFGASSAGGAFVAAYAVNGLAQATGWPGNVKAMAEWTTPADRGRVMGLWSTCYQAGGVLATVVCARAAAEWGWRAAFWLPACVMVFVALLVGAFLRPGPRSTDLSPSPLPEARDRRSREPLDAEARAARAAVLRSPLVYSYGAAYFCIKLVRYSLLFWLPFYLERALGHDKTTAAYLSTGFEVGGLAGAIGLGWLSDRLARVPRATVSAAALVGLAGALWLFGSVAGASPSLCFASLALVGALLFGPDSLLSGAAAQDAGGPHGAALAAGLVNGIGSLGAILQEGVTRGVSSRWGWEALFRVFVGLALAAALCLAPAARQAGRSRA
jgi:sugar phosphate permease